MVAFGEWSPPEIGFLISLDIYSIFKKEKRGRGVFGGTPEDTILHFYGARL
jgi:hypothetical protein